MSEETKEILNKLLEYFKESNINDFGYEQDKLISYKEAQILLNYITNLQQKVEQLEKENKELNRMCELYSQSLYNADLTKAEKKVEQLENIRKEAIEYIEGWQSFPHTNCTTHNELKNLLNILNKGDNKE